MTNSKRSRTELRDDLLKSCMEGDPIWMNRLLREGADANMPNGFGVTALMWAAYGGEIECVRDLLIAGADPKTKDKEGRAALSWAAKRGEEEIVLTLLPLSDVNSVDLYGNTAAQIALKYSVERIHDLICSFARAREESSEFDEMMEGSTEKTIRRKL